MSNISTLIILNGGKDEDENGLPVGLTKVNGKTILEHHIDRAIKAGITNIIISTYYKDDLFEALLDSLNYADINIYTTKEKMALKSGGAIKNTLLNTNTEHAIVIAGSTYSDFDLKDFLDFHNANDNDYSMVNGQGISNAWTYIVSSDMCGLTHLQNFSFTSDVLPQIDGEISVYKISDPIYNLTKSADRELLNQK